MIRPGGALVLLAALAGTAVDAVAQERARTIAELEGLAATDSLDPIVHHELAMAYWARKRWDDAERTLHRAVELAPQYADAWLALAVLPEMRGSSYWKRFAKQRGDAAVDSVFIQAGRHYRRAFRANPLVDLRVLGKVPSTRPRVRVGGLVMVLNPWWHRDYIKAINELHTGRYDAAFERLDKLLAHERAGEDGANVPDGVLWYHGLAAAHLGWWETAIRDFAVLTGSAMNREADELTAIPMQANGYRYLLATVLLLAGRSDEAAPVFRRALEFDVGLYEAHVQLARIYESRGDWDAAVAERQRAIETNPDDAGLVMELGVTLLRAGRADEAVAAFERAAARNPRDPRVFYLLGELALARGDTPGARTAFSRFLAIAPSRYADQRAVAEAELARLPSPGAAP